ncbi:MULTISPECIES: 16S rRNA (cytidine(1402)-2'-O)-methyltransferase [unclassified Acidisoma]|jgi:16S rRNA (cytidine1402-2'-O)-methyltransferase|uniref:16S rRNA (cytidine(1402)-2'-O)-methyltransferase n=1 Tax=unclassified Acidisoma TaxID=2634065 RepID=UPI0020B122FD|nr:MULTISPECIES: 16S rRNA (cytidine(1402)-2'-O)-methyltransferase [unclassified Acidisoma]
MMAGSPAGLVLVSTPIGNLGDVSMRAIATLRAAETILCEDSRVTARLLSALGIRGQLDPLHDHNEEERLPRLLAALRGGRRMALVSDAGTPLLSDPGYRLVRALLAEGIAVTAVPGPNAALTALTLSGLPPHPFLFVGFAPPRGAARRAAFARIRAAEAAGLAATLIWHEAPHRVAEMLEDLRKIFGDRQAALARELTKRFEELRRGSLTEILAGVETDPPRGEITVLLGPPAETDAEPEDLDARLRAALATSSLKQAVATVTGETGLPRRQVYARALALDR